MQKNSTKKKTIWIDITSLKKNQISGMGMFTQMYIDILKDEYNLKYFYNPFLNLPHQLKLYWLWINSYFFIKTCFYKPDVIIFPCYFMPTIIRKKTTYYTVFHDLMTYRPQFFKNAPNIFLRNLRIAIKNCQKIITVSNTVKQQFINELNIPEKKIAITYNRVNDIIKNTKEDLNILNKLNIKPDNYIFSLAGSFKHKNIQALIEATKDLKKDINLVLAGYKGDLQYPEISNNKIIYAGYLTTEEIIALYKNAKFFVLPSFEEGFGIPIIEAQYFYCPVLCSDIPVFREVAGNGAEFCGTDSKSIMDKIIYLLNSPERIKELSILGHKNQKRFEKNIIKGELISIIENE